MEEKIVDSGKKHKNGNISSGYHVLRIRKLLKILLSLERTKWNKEILLYKKTIKK